MKSRKKSRTDELINDLNAVREAVLNKKHELSPAEYASLEPRLFESWVIEKLAQNESLVMAMREEMEKLRRDLAERMEALRKSLPRPEKKTRKRET